MRTLPKVVANTKVGKSVQLKIWRNKKLISKRLTLGRLSHLKNLKKKNLKLFLKIKILMKLKITVRDITE